MATVTPGSMAGSNVTAARTAVSAADSDYTGDTIGTAVDCAGLKRLLIVAQRTAGTGTITVQPCMHVVTARSTAGAPTASFLAKGASFSLDDGGTATIEVMGRFHSLHVSALTAGSTWTLHVGVGEPFWADAARVG